MMTGNAHHPKLKVLHENDFGFIGKCLCCNEIQFCIGNVVSFMPESDYFRLYRSFQKIEKGLKHKIVEMPNGHRLMLRTPVDNFLLSLTIREFRQVMDLFDQAALKLHLMETLEKVESLN